MAFLKRTPFSILQRASTSGPVIIVNVTQIRSDAILIQPGGPVVILLHKATPSATADLVRAFSEITREFGLYAPGRPLMVLM
ncbi:hypothetical protein FRB94_003300 [Tulasnella sp. JGI-2019a]|nr:hypothetical protein FRB94_003300 [Tulasnella sp. JGI-2019a]